MLYFLKNNSGYIAVEFGGIFKGYGSEVHIIIRKDKILTGFDEDTRTHLQEQMIEQGFHIHTMTNIAKVTKEAEDSYVVSLIEKNEMEAYFAGNKIACNEHEKLDCEPLCSMYCASRTPKDGYCDFECNSKECKYDGGDCI